MSSPTNLLECFLTGFVLVFLLTPLVQRLQIIDQPNQRKIHLCPTPKAGGLGIAIAIFISTIIWNGGLSPILAIIILVALLGLWDDLRTISPLAKLIGQVSLAVLTVLSGHYFMLTGTMFDQVGSMLWLVAIMNAFNLIDGMDGLASGVAVFGLGAFLIAGLYGSFEMSLIVSTAIGGCLAFVWFNRPPAKVFLGDTGSLMLGYLLGISAILISQTTDKHWVTTVTAIAFILMFPLFDMILTIVRRSRIGRPIFAPDRSHTYNLVVDNLGWTVKKTICFFYGMCLLGGLVGALVYVYDIIGLSICALIILLLVATYMLMKYSKTNSVHESYLADVSMQK